MVYVRVINNKSVSTPNIKYHDARLFFINHRGFDADLAKQKEVTKYPQLIYSQNIQLPHNFFRSLIRMLKKERKIQTGTSNLSARKPPPLPPQQQHEHELAVSKSIDSLDVSGKETKPLATAKSPSKLKQMVLSLFPNCSLLHNVNNSFAILGCDRLCHMGR